MQAAGVAVRLIKVWQQAQVRYHLWLPHVIGRAAVVKNQAFPHTNILVM
jgi:hypothetical protein